jgi:AcrR family transcriptional regulator
MPTRGEIMKRKPEPVVEPAGRGPTLAAEQRIKQIVHEAAKLFDRVGYHDANMEMVAEAANMRKPTLYHYIKSKEEILLRIHQTLLDDLNARHRENLAQGLNREELLLGNVTDILRYIAQNRGYVRAFFENYRQLEPGIRKQISVARQAYFKIITDLIADGVAAGVYHTDDVTLSALFLLGQVNWAYQWYRPDTSPPPEAIAHEILDTFLYGLTRPFAARRAAGKALAKSRPAASGAKKPAARPTNAAATKPAVVAGVRPAKPRKR